MSANPPEIPSSAEGTPHPPLAPVPPWHYRHGMDPDHIAFRELLRRAATDPTLAAELSRLMAELAPLSVLLSLTSAAALPASAPKSRTPDTVAGDR